MIAGNWSLSGYLIIKHFVLYVFNFFSSLSYQFKTNSRYLCTTLSIHPAYLWQSHNQLQG